LTDPFGMFALGLEDERLARQARITIRSTSAFNQESVKLPSIRTRVLSSPGVAAG